MELIEKLKEYLSTTKNDNSGSWVEVKKEEIDELYVLLREIIEYKFGTDYKGNPPIGLIVKNKQNYFMPQDNYITSWPKWEELTEQQKVDELRCIQLTISHYSNLLGEKINDFYVDRYFKDEN